MLYSKTARDDGIGSVSEPDNRYRRPNVGGAGVKPHTSMLGTNFQEKILVETSGKKLQTFHCNNVTTMKSLGIFSRNLRENFFLKNGLLKGLFFYETRQKNL